MSQTVASILVDVLEKIGVKQIFGLIGSGTFATALLKYPNYGRQLELKPAS
jgi:thiamine pyrophosphate-dependent acetolactate synthase large subunit-like protein